MKVETRKRSRVVLLSLSTLWYTSMMNTNSLFFAWPDFSFSSIRSLHLPLFFFRRVDVDDDSDDTSPTPTAREREDTHERIRLFHLVSLRLSAFVRLFMSYSRTPSPYFSVFFVLFYSTIVYCCVVFSSFFCCIVRARYAGISIVSLCSFAIY